MNVPDTSSSSLLPPALYGKHSVCVCIDRGGTFTDCVGTFPVEPCAEYPDGERTVVVKLLSEDPAHYPDAPREGIRRILETATGKPHPRNLPLDTSNLKFIRMGTTVATNALLERKGEPCALDRKSTRPRIFDLSIAKPDVLYKEVVQIDERVTLIGYTMDPRPAALDKPLQASGDAVLGKSGEYINVLSTPDWDAVRRDLQRVYDGGIRSVAVCLMHSYTFTAHEERVGSIARDIGFTHITLSSALVPMIKIVPRAHSATADAYLTPVIRRYVDGFAAGFDNGISNIRVDFMQSDGGLAPVDHFSGLRAILSGPAAGVVGYAVTSYNMAARVPVIGFDMGGTSTDVSRFDGRLEHVFETTTAGITVQAPQLDINTVAAGGGSRLFFRNGLMAVGPESAGAHPGPACYRKGGPLAVTDANLLLGRLRAEHFPAIFGDAEDEPLDIEATRKLFTELASYINSKMQSERASLGQAHEEKSIEQVALGFLQVANEAMCRPIRALTEAKGHDVQKHALACFGGAGGQHACAVAANLGIRRVFVHRLASVLSAHGLGLAEVVHEEQEPAADICSENTLQSLLSRLDKLTASCHEHLNGQGFSDFQIKTERFLNMRYDGTDTAIMVPETAGGSSMHLQEFGFVHHDRDIIVDDLPETKYGEKRLIHIFDKHPAYLECVAVYFQNGYYGLSPGDIVCGPAIVLDRNSTVLVEPGWNATVTANQLVLEHTRDASDATSAGSGRQHATKELDPIQLSVFAHRFMSIAEQMGRTLEKTSRLDFSCALFDQSGNLVANAPHIPVHLGSIFANDLSEGDAGGSHLPDITVITPVFKDNSIIFFVASRGHHADIGGILPELFQEGASTMGIKIDAIRRVLLEEPAKHPGCSGTRNYRDIAANHRGIGLYGLGVRTAELAVRSLLKETRHDFMDDGSRISLSIDIDEDGSAVFDFAGTSPEVYGNTNAPPSVTYSAIIYCLRCMGCLAPVNVVIPKGSFLFPSATAAVVGGNVLTSQRLCDVILSAFSAAAASQGSIEEDGKHYEGWGGHGAGPTWDGQSGIFERRYPVILRQFSLRHNTGGKGTHSGGDGCIREIEFLKAMIFSPPGLEGGENGAYSNEDSDGDFHMLSLDRIVIMTPASEHTTGDH
ncbi:Hydantoinase/oxoprolinase-domain-containing protein [Coemansia spiralis]|nr:Hydantoinase/oxoprolinase-domain-containing protein [Coemansia spiralis]